MPLQCLISTPPRENFWADVTPNRMSTGCSLLSIPANYPGRSRLEKHWAIASAATSVRRIIVLCISVRI